MVTKVLTIEEEIDLIRRDERNQGLKEGLKEGLNQGLKEGENKKTIEIAKNLLNLNVDIETIVKASGLSKDAIKNMMSN